MDKTKYCSFHKDYGHTTEGYHKLKDEIEFHVRMGHGEGVCAAEPARKATGRRSQRFKVTG